MKAYIFIVLLSAAIAGIGCEVDHGLEPIRSSINGTITFVGDWPKSLEDIQIIASTKLPPTDIVSLPLDLKDVTEGILNYTFYVPPGSYLIGVAWREKDSPWDLSSIAANYPDTVVVETDTSQVEGIDIVVDFRIGIISGTVTLIGTRPTETHLVGIVVCKRYPVQSVADIANLPDLVSGSALVPIGVSTYDYPPICVAPGTYPAVVVVWKATGTSLYDIESYKEIGAYYSDSGEWPAIVEVIAGKRVTGIDIAADFGRLE